MEPTSALLMGAGAFALLTVVYLIWRFWLRILITLALTAAIVFIISPQGSALLENMGVNGHQMLAPLVVWDR